MADNCSEVTHRGSQKTEADLSEVTARADGSQVVLTKSLSRAQLISDGTDILLRFMIVVLFVKLELMVAFKREVHAEELWLYKYPPTKDIISPVELIVSVILVPFCVTLIHYLLTKDLADFRAASWSWTLSLALCGIPTSAMKVAVGRLRPDFFYRCFPDGVMVLNNLTTQSVLDFACTGNESAINEGRKSFPSGHASFAFASLGFIALYWSGKLHILNQRGRGKTWRLIIVSLPIFAAGLVSISRTCDYHHHWEDVIVGMLIGVAACHFGYRQYYPALSTDNCHKPLERWPKSRPSEASQRQRHCYDVGNVKQSRTTNTSNTTVDVNQDIKSTSCVLVEPHEKTN